MNKQKNSVYTPKERLINGIFRENPIFVLTLGICPALATTTSAFNGLGMGLTTAVVLALSNVLISLIRNLIPDRVRIPAFIVIIASFVTMMEFILQVTIPVLYSSLGIYIPLIAVNCIILGRVEAFASKENAFLTFFDSLGMGIGFTIALTIIGAFREWLGAGKIFGFHTMPSSYVPVTIFVLAPGAFFVLAFLTAIQNKIKIFGTIKDKDVSGTGSGCSDDCRNCSKKTSCNQGFYDTSKTDKSEISENTNNTHKSEISENTNNTHKSEISENTNIINNNPPPFDKNSVSEKLNKENENKKDTEQKTTSRRKKTTGKQVKEIKEEEKKAKKEEYRAELDAYSSTDEDYNFVPEDDLQKQEKISEESEVDK